MVRLARVPRERTRSGISRLSNCRSARSATTGDRSAQRPPDRNGKRVYTDDDVRRLKFINRLKVLGLSLAEMVELEKIYRKQRNNREILPKLLQLLDERAVQLDERVAQLVALKKQIREYQQRLRTKVLQDATREEPRTTGEEMRS